MKILFYPDRLELPATKSEFGKLAEYLPEDFDITISDQWDTLHALAVKLTNSGHEVTLCDDTAPAEVVKPPKKARKASSFPRMTAKRKKIIITLKEKNMEDAEISERVGVTIAQVEAVLKENA